MKDVSHAFEELIRPLVEGAKSRNVKLAVAFHAVHPDGTRETVAQTAGMEGMEVLASAALITSVLAEPYGKE